MRCFNVNGWSTGVRNRRNALPLLENRDEFRICWQQLMTENVPAIYTLLFLAVGPTHRVNHQPFLMSRRPSAFPYLDLYVTARRRGGT